MPQHKLSDISLLQVSSLPPIPKALLFFIPGNPGCIAYYEQYLKLLKESFRPSTQPSISSTEPDTTSIDLSTTAITATSLANFGLDPTAPTPFSLEGQIEFVEAQLLDIVGIASSPPTNASDKAKKTKSTKNEGRMDVILVGHSVGAYIAMELMRRWRERLGSDKNDGIRIIGLIGLWPTLTFLADSPSAKRFGSWILGERTAYRMAWLAAIMAFILPVFALQWLVQLVTRHPKQPASITTGFLRRSFSVEQALVLAKHELREIGPDKWADDLWCGAFAAPRAKWRTSVMLYFGKKDHWVDEQVRNALIEARASGDSTDLIKMEIDQQNVPHSFCIEHSEMAAIKTKSWVKEILAKTQS